MATGEVERPLILVERLGPYAILGMDPSTGRLFQRINPPATIQPTGWNCICHPELQYKRPHFTCRAFCRIKRVAQGKLPPLIPVNRYRMYIQLDRVHARFKDWLLRKFVLPIAEWLAN